MRYPCRLIQCNAGLPTMQEWLDIYHAPTSVPINNQGDSDEEQEESKAKRHSRIRVEGKHARERKGSPDQPLVVTGVEPRSESKGVDNKDKGTPPAVDGKQNAQSGDVDRRKPRKIVKKSFKNPKY